ncbi:hypothetical protein H312_00346 [Anncaliia algerae PRA339]|uniref:Uncharacterized protein n=1 Tax=Anncaliia algerae PRA339 TaxID=1288291 RepID=A0A059F4V6_9MICR|nr:hypothetical protein H312_00346 [Anncaliia algerae PRA339]
MILNKILTHWDLIRKYKKIIQLIILLCCMYFFTFTKNTNKILTDESLCDKMISNIKLQMDNYSHFTIVNNVKTVVLNNKSDNDTILIIGNEKDEKLLNRLITNLKLSKVCTKNIKVILGEVELASLKSLYFCILKLTFGKNKCTIIKPLRNYQPNSDLMFISYHYFPPKTSMEYSFLNEYPLNVNYLEIVLSPSIEDSLTFLLFIRSLHNLHSHSLGNYYYVPFESFNISLISFVPFLACNYVYMIFTSLSESMNISFSYSFPFITYFSSVLFILFITDDILYNSFCLLLFLVIDFRIGVMYCYLIFFKNIKDLIFNRNKL